MASWVVAVVAAAAPAKALHAPLNREAVTRTGPAFFDCLYMRTVIQRNQRSILRVSRPLRTGAVCTFTARSSGVLRLM